jgi:Domain of unknown function (DUF4203)
MPEVVVAIITIVVGLISCFYGYVIFRVVFMLVGLIAGYLVGVQLVPPDQWVLAIIIGVVIGLICALLAYPFWSIGVTISGLVLGYAFFSNLGTTLNLSPTLTVVLGVLGAIVVGVLFFLAKDPMIMLATAFSGASYTIYGITRLFPDLALRTNTGVATILVFVLGLVGFLVQYRLFSDRHLYSQSQITEPI